MNINSLLFFARDAQTKTPKVIKYLTKYGIEVHQALSDAGLAPVLYDSALERRIHAGELCHSFHLCKVMSL